MIRGAVGRRCAVVLATALLAACAALPPSGGTTPSDGMRTASGLVGSPDSQGTGQLVLAIRWPEGPGRDLRGYHAQLVPDSTAKLKIKVTKNGSDVITPVVVDRPSGQSVTSTVVPVNANTGLVVTVEAYETDTSGTKIAEVSQTGVAVVSSQDTALTLTLASLYTPSITSISPTYARVGASITITGSNLAKSWRASGPTVLFPGSSGTVAATPTSVADGTLAVTVPSGATSGTIQVKTDGVTGGSAAFEIGATLTVNAGGTIPTSVATYKAKIERDTDSNGSYETNLFTTISVAAGSMPMQLSVPQGGGYQVTLDGYPASNAPASNGGSIAVGTSTLTLNLGTTTASTTPSLAARYVPGISGFNPSSAGAGSTVTISGSNFSSAWVGSSTPVVKFAKAGGETTTASVSSFGDTSIVVTVPSDADDGDVTVTQDGLTSAGAAFSLPVAVSALSAGEAHTLAVVGGQGRAWGYGANGQLGNGSTNNQSSPIQITGLSTLTKVAGGYAHSLGLTSDGTVWSWGANDRGQLGTGTTNSSLVPAAVTGLTNVDSIFSGARAQHSLATKSDGTLWTWGYNTFGQLGIGNSNDQLSPVQVVALSNVSAAAGGQAHTLALKADGTVWTCGANDWGQLGIGNTTLQSSPVQVNITAVTGVSAGLFHSLAVKSDGTVWAWGYNGQGQLGNGTVNNSMVPVQVSALTGVTAVAAGYSHSMALKSDGTVWAWGNNDFGKLGINSTAVKLTPDTPTQISDVAAIAAGTHHSLALTSSGGVKGWGYNFFSQLGDGTTDNRLVPISITVN